MVALIQDPARLRERIDSLWKRRGDDREDGLEIEALAEAHFRLAVHPSAQAEDALDLLKAAIRLDGANPKFPYHLARLYFVHGDLDRAAEWLERALQICPTSHRIWAHVSLLQRELNERHGDDERYDPGALRKRSQQVASAIRDGSDPIDGSLLDFKPPKALAYQEEMRRRAKASRGILSEPEREPDEEPSPEADLTSSRVPLRRLEGADSCRWSGINDLLAEELLEAGVPSKRNRAKLLQLLEVIAERTEARCGGDAALATAAIELLVSGYPTTAIGPALERLRTNGSESSLELLELVRSLFEAEEGDVPGLLAQALEQGRLPPILAAVVHHRRLLWRPMTIAGLGLTYRRAKAYLEEVKSKPASDEAEERTQAGQAMQHVDELARAARDLEAGRAAPVAAWEADGGLEDSDPATQVKALAAKAGEMTKERKEKWARLRELHALSSDRELEPAELAELEEIAQFAERLSAETDSAISQIDAIKAAGVIEGEDAVESIDRIRHGFQTLASKRGPFLKRLANVRPEPPPTPQATQEGKDVPDYASGEELPEAPRGLPRLEQALDEIHRRVEERFARANATFEHYSANSLRLVPLRALRASVLAREAEALYRLGRVGDARRAWIRVTREDPLSLGALKNLAVADAADPDDSRDLGSWRRFAETLYYYDVVAGSPHPRAHARAEFHRNFGGAYAPDPLSAEGDLQEIMGDLEEIEESELVGFLGSRTRTRLFVDHKLLEVLNAKLAFTSPPLILGVTRSEGEALRAGAQRGLLSLIDDVSLLLPERVRGAFATLCRDRVEAAYRACQSARRITLEGDPSYRREIDKQVQLVKAVCELKYRLYVMLMAKKNAERMVSLESFEFLNELARLDRIPIGSSPELLRKACDELRVGEDPSIFLGMLGMVRKNIFGMLTQRDQSGQVLPAVLSHIATDDEDSELVAMACGIAAREAQRTKSNAGLDMFVCSVGGWLERARARLERAQKVREGEAEEIAGDEEDLTENAIEAVARGLDEAAVAVACAEFGGLGEGTDWGSVASALTSLIDSYPVVAEGSEAHYMRMVARAQTAPADNGREEQLARVRSIRDDAKVVIERSTDEQRRAQAQRFLTQAEEGLSQVQAD